MSHHVIKIILCILFASVLVACSDDDDGDKAADTVDIQQVYMPELAPGQTTGAVYLKMINQSDQAKILNYVETSAAGMAHIHRNFYEDGVMKMRMAKHLTVPPKGTIRFEPGSYHVMLMDIAETFEPGATFPLVFHFQEGESVSVQATVKARH